MKKYFECHITMEYDSIDIQAIVEKACDWTFSQIDGDPDLGPGVKCYATKQYNFKHDIKDVIDWVSITADLLKECGIKVLREKVELVIYDKRNI